MNKEQEDDDVEVDSEKVLRDYWTPVKLQKLNQAMIDGGLNPKSCVHPKDKECAFLKKYGAVSKFSSPDNFIAMMYRDGSRTYYSKSEKRSKTTEVLLNRYGQIMFGMDILWRLYDKNIGLEGYQKSFENNWKDWAGAVK